MQYVTKIQYKRRYLSHKGAVPRSIYTDSLPDVQWDGDFPENANWDDSSFQQIPLQFNWDLRLTGTKLAVIFRNTTKNRVVNHFNIDMDMLSTADGQTLWYIADSVVNDNTPDDETLDAQEYNVSTGELINSYASTLASKDFAILGKNSLIAFFVTKDNPSANDIIPIIIRPAVKTDGDNWNETPEIGYHGITLFEGHEDYADHTVTVTGNLTKHALDPVIKLTFELMPEITVTSSTLEGDIMTVNFETADTVNFIYLVQDAGYLPKVKVPVTNGSGSFKVVTTGMDTGDVVKVKLGFKYWTNRTTFTTTL